MLDWYDVFTLVLIEADPLFLIGIKHLYTRNWLKYFFQGLLYHCSVDSQLQKPYLNYLGSSTWISAFYLLVGQLLGVFTL